MTILLGGNLLQDTEAGRVNASTNSMVTVEFYGVPRLRAGRGVLHVRAGSVAKVLAAVVEACPGLRGLVQPDGRLAPHYLLSINGRQFPREPDQLLQPGDQVILLSADVGG
jgi:molybdopterin synthase sulfur carrier subunit